MTLNVFATTLIFIGLSYNSTGNASVPTRNTVGIKLTAFSHATRHIVGPRGDARGPAMETRNEIVSSITKNNTRPDVVGTDHNLIQLNQSF